MKIVKAIVLEGHRVALIVAGDSDSDYPMMQLAAKLVEEGKARAAICIDVGGKIKDPHNLIDVAFKENEGYPHSQIDRLYQFFDDIWASCEPTRNNVPLLRRDRNPKPAA